MKDLALALRLTHTAGWLLMVAATFVFEPIGRIDWTAELVFAGLAVIGLISHHFLLRHVTLFALVLVVSFIPIGTLAYAITKMSFIGDETLEYLTWLAFGLFVIGFFLLLLPASLFVSVCADCTARRRHVLSI